MSLLYTSLNRYNFRTNLLNHTILCGFLDTQISRCASQSTASRSGTHNRTCLNCDVRHDVTPVTTFFGALSSILEMRIGTSHNKIIVVIC